MIKESLKTYLDKYFESYKSYMGTYPVVPYDEDEKSSLWFGEMDEDEYIQWKYEEKGTQTDFLQLEKDLGITLSSDIKEFYNSYYFLQLQGFFNGESVVFDGISDKRDVLQDLKLHIFEIENKKYIQMGLYSNIDLALCMENDTGQIMAVDFDNADSKIIADSLEILLNGMKPTR